MSRSMLVIIASLALVILIALASDLAGISEELPKAEAQPIEFAQETPSPLHTIIQDNVLINHYETDKIIVYYIGNGMLNWKYDKYSNQFTEITWGRDYRGGTTFYLTQLSIRTWNERYITTYSFHGISRERINRIEGS